MKVKKVLELSIDVQDIFREVPLAIRAMLETLPTPESQVAFLRTVRQDVDTILKGAEAYAEPVRESSRQ